MLKCAFVIHGYMNRRSLRCYCTYGDTYKQNYSRSTVLSFLPGKTRGVTNKDCYLLSTFEPPLISNLFFYLHSVVTTFLLQVMVHFTPLKS